MYTDPLGTPDRNNQRVLSSSSPFGDRHISIRNAPDDTATIQKIGEPISLSLFGSERIPRNNNSILN